MTAFLRWAPPLVLGVGALFTVGIDLQQSMPLRSALGSAVSMELAGLSGGDVTLSDADRSGIGSTEYLVRSYRGAPGTNAQLSLYVAYYARQRRGKTIHSPKNCLPGNGWQALSSTTAIIATTRHVATVNRYLVQRGNQRAVVLYWYQGRGRVAANEYLVKFDLVRDSALRRRSEEALVRIVVPVTEEEDQAFELAREAAEAVILALETALPT
jgi:EpsI family protein